MFASQGKTKANMGGHRGRLLLELWLYVEFKESVLHSLWTENRG